MCGIRFWGAISGSAPALRLWTNLAFLNTVNLVPFKGEFKRYCLFTKHRTNLGVRVCCGAGEPDLKEARFALTAGPEEVPQQGG